MTTRAGLIVSQEAAFSPLYAVFVVSQTEAEANSVKTMKVNAAPRVTLG